MLIPTRRKLKISSSFSYPLGAASISTELAGVPQAQSLEIDFSPKYERVKTKSEPYSIFTISYSGTRSHRDAGWRIDIRPVPQAETHGKGGPHPLTFFLTHSLSVVFNECDEPMLQLEEYHTPGEALSN
jgi:hypothetical protein